MAITIRCLVTCRAQFPTRSQARCPVRLQARFPTPWPGRPPPCRTTFSPLPLTRGSTSKGDMNRASMNRASSTSRTSTNCPRSETSRTRNNHRRRVSRGHLRCLKIALCNDQHQQRSHDSPSPPLPPHPVTRPHSRPKFNRLDRHISPKLRSLNLLGKPPSLSRLHCARPSALLRADDRKVRLQIHRPPNHLPKPLA